MKMERLWLGSKRIAGATLAAAGLMLGTALSASAQVVTIATVEGAAGTDVEFQVTLSADPGTTAIVVNDIGVTGVPIALKDNGKPDCTVNAAINKTSSSFSLLPRNCTPGGGDTPCTTLRGAVLSLDPNTARDPIPDGLLYTCKVRVPAGTADGTEYALTSVKVTATTNADTPVDVDVTSMSVSGKVTVAPPVVDTATPTPTATATPPPTSAGTNTPTKKPTSVPGGGGGGDDDGCQVVAPANSNAGWLLMIPAAVLVLRRRRVR